MKKTMERTTGGAGDGGTSVLLIGYNGANNTGSEALLLRDIEDLRSVFGPGVRITIPTLNEENLRRYVTESETLRITAMPPLYFMAIRRLVAEHDLVLLVEGSTYMDSWGSPLLWAFLWATFCAHRQGKRSLAYAVDSGRLSAFNGRLVRGIASLTDLIVTRTAAAAGRLRALGVSAPIEVTADNAFLFDEYSPGGSRTAGIGFAVVDFFLFPAVMRPWGRKKNCYRRPYYFSTSVARTRAREALARGYAQLIDGLVERTGKRIALICMEQLDEPLAREIRVRMRHPEAASVFSSKAHSASAMTELLRSLELLVTSRFHASVLSLPAGVPQIAVGHDERLSTLHRDLGLGEEWFLDARKAEALRDPDGVMRELFSRLDDRLRALMAAPEAQAELLRRGCAEHIRRARRNRELLASFAGMDVRPAAGTEAGLESPEPVVKSEKSVMKGGVEWVA